LVGLIHLPPRWPVQNQYFKSLAVFVALVWVLLCGLIIKAILLGQPTPYLLPQVPKYNINASGLWSISTLVFTFTLCWSSFKSLKKRLWLSPLIALGGFWAIQSLMGGESYKIIYLKWWAPTAWAFCAVYLCHYASNLSKKTIAGFLSPNGASAFNLFFMTALLIGLCARSVDYYHGHSPMQTAQNSTVQSTVKQLNGLRLSPDRLKSFETLVYQVNKNQCKKGTTYSLTGHPLIYYLNKLRSPIHNPYDGPTRRELIQTTLFSKQLCVLTFQPELTTDQSKDELPTALKASAAFFDWQSYDIGENLVLLVGKNTVKHPKKPTPLKS
jgi:hypothetical protein